MARRSSKVLPAGTHHELVALHQVEKKSWQDVTLQEQLNCECDYIAKLAIKRLQGVPWREQIDQLLPLEPVSLEVGGITQTSNPAAAMRWMLGQNEAETFYQKELGWPKDTFNCVSWDALDATLDIKGDPFCLWMSKQVNGFCRTQVMVPHWDRTRYNTYPD